ncbi:3-oxoacyl-[acyl-carrier-protein] reductase FabG [Paenibacillus allorhizoplanae]|uniref:3-oxoacyl-[acyl-carrier-protein] reductase FabG n=1 Tax=Paenibacillus allorhizoplanae TaxID=2905648 RepID=A0ABN8GK63_9BACL|nr:SDR family NAD(P)-dependent oxidoreductase [Paenibacillus allorhizoplanae]CAH1211034.1 3-oxoacyl-[acyl-carrier-protein] reductase FabG [Paenibacillus allorhizoplanae]
MRLLNKVALVTGSSLGIGRAIALRFAREGAKVAVIGLEKDMLDEVRDLISGEGGEVMTFESDVQYKIQMESVLDSVIGRWGCLDVVVNNAGICKPTPFLDITEEEWDRHMNINLKATFLVSQLAARQMVRQGRGGSIIQMSSVNGLAAEADQAHYNTTKGGINLLMMSMALELAKDKIRVNSLCPGFIETRLTKPLLDNPQAIGEYLKTIPMQEVGQPEDIANAALYLASDESRYMTGHCMVVDGGQLSRLS